MKLATDMIINFDFEHIHDTLDYVHDNAGSINQVTALSKEEIIDWLQEIIFVASETISEIGESENE